MVSTTSNFVGSHFFPLLRSVAQMRNYPSEMRETWMLFTQCKSHSNLRLRFSYSGGQIHQCYRKAYRIKRNFLLYHWHRENENENEKTRREWVIFSHAKHKIRHFGSSTKNQLQKISLKMNECQIRQNAMMILRKRYPKHRSTYRIEYFTSIIRIKSEIPGYSWKFIWNDDTDFTDNWNISK